MESVASHCTDLNPASCKVLTNWVISRQYISMILYSGCSFVDGRMFALGRLALKQGNTVNIGGNLEREHHPKLRIIKRSLIFID